MLTLFRTRAEAVVVLVDEALGRAEPAFAATVHAACAGNPLLLRELLRALGAAGVDATEVGVARVLEIGFRSLGDRVRDRLVGLGGAAVALARAVAVLGDNATLRLAADLAAIDLDAADAAADALVRADVLEARRPLRFVHPLVRAAVYAGMGTGERHHAEAVRLLVATGAPPAEVAAHLLATSPGRVADAVPVLRDAAARAASEGAADGAIAYLRRALAEPLDATGSVAAQRADPSGSARATTGSSLVSQPR